ncbi:MAG: polyribonucleotide nucleotidyltransferase [Chloroflexaceae bacterium]|nr:polyribonucleotide nucleotidyltransferase [Chloroflexaceae bacterium]
MTNREVYTVSAEIAGRTLTLESGKFAEQADGAVTVRYGDTVLLATVVAAREAREGADFFPLTVDYEEKMYAAGKIPGNYFKREGKPTNTAILISRLTDRPLRPLFPKGYRNEVQVIVTTFSIDTTCDPGALAIIGASAALSISSIPFAGPVGAVQMGHLNGSLTVNPSMSETETSGLDLLVAGTDDAVLMVEAGANELSEADMLTAIQQGHAVCKQLVALQRELVAKCGKPKLPFEPPASDTSLEEAVAGYIGGRLRAAINDPNKMQREEQTNVLHADVLHYFTADEPPEELPTRQAAVSKVFDTLLKAEVRNAILERGERVDGRTLTEVRPLSMEVGMIPRVHGSGLFARGQTQVLTITTLGSPSEEQRLDDLGTETSKTYMHHYNFPPFSTGEARRLGGPRRRDIGHGALAERALYAVLPDDNDFPYTMRLVSEVLSSNGSSSMASVCGSSLSLMDAGVPIKRHVAGIAMGLVTDDNGRWTVLTDIQGIEDALGDMDFKVAGTSEGITGLQLDIKTTGVTFEIMRIAFEQARQARLFILDAMQSVLPTPRPELSPYAPRIVTLQIPVDKIGALIGPGGKTIRTIIDETGATIDVEPDGRVFIATADESAAQRAVEMIEGLTRDPKVGDIFLGKVVRIMNYGAFVNILPGKDGMVHISELASGRVKTVEEIVQIGDDINVIVTDVDAQGKISLSRRALLEGESSSAGSSGGSSGGNGGKRDDTPRSSSRSGADRPRPRRREP